MDHVPQHPWDLVGPPEAADKYFNPVDDKHRKKLKAIAPELDALLDQGFPKTAANAYSTHDADAIRTQEVYKKTLNTAVVFSLLAAFFAAFAAVYGGMIKDLDWLPPAWDLLIVRTLVLIQIVCLLVSGWFVWVSADKKEFQAWRRERAKAEHARVHLFFAVIADASSLKSGPKVLKQALSYTLRYLYESQRLYFNSSAGSHETKAGKRKERRRTLIYFTWFSMALAVLFAIFTFIAIFAPENLSFVTADHGIEAALGGVGVIVAAMLAGGQAKEVIHRDEENARRYRVTLEQLEEHGGSWASPSKSFLKAFEEAEQGHPNQARAWTEDLVAILVAEHAQWVSAKPSELRLGPVDDLVARP